MWNNAYNVALLIVGDKAYAGEREDKCAPLLKNAMEGVGCKIIEMALVPDEEMIIRDKLLDWSKNTGADLILTSGGTGFSKRDCTPEATLAVGDKQVPGICEAIRSITAKNNIRAILSRAVSVICNDTLIINLPGNPYGALEALNAVLPVLEHGLDILTHNAGECGSPPNENQYF